MLALAETVIGSPATHELLASRAGGPVVWRVKGPGGTAVVKQHAADRAFAQEQAALVGMYIEGLMPRLFAHELRTRALVLEDLRGAPPGSSAGAPIHRSAGAVLRQLHAGPAPVDPLDLGNAVGERLDAAIAAARPLMAPSIIEAAGPWRERADLFAGEPRVACHRDFAPYNWLVDVDGERVRVVDFEHARPDHWLVDLVKLQTSAWVEDPSLRKAFLDGYGRRLEPADEQRLELLCLLHGLVTTTWAHRHGDRELSAQGRQIIERLGLVR